MAVKKRFGFPTPYTILILVIVLAAVATFLLPSGNYDTLTYDATSKVFVIKSDSDTENLPATQESLDKLGIRIDAEKLISGDIKKPVAIPGSYKSKDSNPQGIGPVIQAPIHGIHQAIDVILFVLILGGFIGVFSRSGAFDIGMQHLAYKLKGRESWLIIIVTTLMAIGGTTFGLAEETIAFYPILVPVFLAAGYDVMVPLAVIYVGSSMGFMASTVNPFATIIASYAAGITWTAGILSRLIMLVLGTGICIAWILRYANKVKRDPTKSILHNKNEGKNLSYPTVLETGQLTAMDGKTRLLLVLFALTFVVMIYGVARMEWWFVEMTALFLVTSVIIGIVQRINEKEFILAFINGAKELLGVAFIIGIARGVAVILDAGLVSDTILYYAADSVDGMSSVFFIVSLMFVYAGLTIFIPSSSGMAVLTMPILGGLAEVAGVPREQIINAYLFGMGIMGFLTPAGLILPSLAMVNVNYDTWLKFIMPLIGILVLISTIVLSIGVMTG
jgi:uncharacterized ion transporter superfamily protein YfcC